MLFPIFYDEMTKSTIKREEAIDYSLTAFQQMKVTSAGIAVAAIAQRGSSTQGDLAAQVRREQDLAAGQTKLEGELIAAGSIDNSSRDPAAEKKARDKLAAIEGERMQVEKELREKFPEFVAFAKPQPLALKSIQSLLATDEALVVISLAGKNSYIWGITSEGAEWKKLDVTAAESTEKIKAIRSSLDVNEARPFDANLSFALYKEVFEPIDGLIGAKFRISLVVDGELAKIPLHVLVSADPSGKSFREMRWLIRSHAVTIIPSINSLSVLRSRPSAAGSKPLLGFADPIFSKMMQLPSLPDSAEELSKVAQGVKADSADLFFGREATESRVKQTKLEQYRILYFATHALLAGQLANELSEAALVLTTPEESTELDDGLLTASEVAQLKLDADWVVLSACNTGSGDRAQTESLSGLAQAFFYAGARSLLVSNWAVDTKSSAKLMEGIFDALAADPTLSHAEALRLSMLAMIEGNGDPTWADPKFWAPFVVVGEPKKTIH
jgi:CHAT domain-containing protein